jgi:hypothetical protein
MQIEISKQERGIGNNKAELAKYGYVVLKNKQLIDFKLIVQQQHVHEMDFRIKTVRLGVFNFRAFLNLSMLLIDGRKPKKCEEQ